MWYAVQEKPTDEWGYGSSNLDEARKMLFEQGDGLIAVIDNDVCVREITYLQCVIDDFENWILI